MNGLDVAQIEVVQHLRARTDEEVLRRHGRLQPPIEEESLVGQAGGERREPAVEVGRVAQRAIHQFVVRLLPRSGAVEVEIEGVIRSDGIFQIQLADPIVRAVVAVRSERPRFAAQRREGGIGAAVPGVAHAGGVAKAVAPDVVGRGEIEIQALDEEVFALGLERNEEGRSMVVGAAIVPVDALDALARGGEDKFRFEFVEPPLRFFDRAAEHRFAERIVAAAHTQVVLVVERHFIVVVRRDKQAAQAQLEPEVGKTTFEDGVGAVGVVAPHLVGRIEIAWRIVFEHDVHRAAHGCAPEAVGHDALVDFHALDHVGGDVVERDKIAYLSGGGAVDVEPHALALETAHRDARTAADSAHGADGHAGHASEHLVERRG